MLIEDQQAESVGDVLLNDPAVRVARGFGNFQQVYLVRGLPVYSDDMSYNGLYGLLPRQYLSSEFIQRVQVFRGANAFLNGAAPGGSGLGGAINVLPKRAPNYAVNQFTLGVESSGQGYGAVDLARRSDDGRAGIRINAARRDGDTAVDGENQKISMSHIGVDFREENLRLSADLGFQKVSMDASMPSITFASGVPSRKPRMPTKASPNPGLTPTLKTCLAPCAQSMTLPITSPPGLLPGPVRATKTPSSPTPPSTIRLATTRLIVSKTFVKTRSLLAKPGFAGNWQPAR